MHSSKHVKGTCHHDNISNGMKEQSRDNNELATSCAALSAYQKRFTKRIFSSVVVFSNTALNTHAAFPVCMAREKVCFKKNPLEVN